MQNALSRSSKRKVQLYTVAALSAACSFVASASTPEIFTLSGLSGAALPAGDAIDDSISTTFSTPIVSGSGNLPAAAESDGLVYHSVLSVDAPLTSSPSGAVGTPTASKSSVSAPVSKLTSVSPSTTTIGNSAPYLTTNPDGNFFYLYNVGTGDVSVHYNGSTFITTAKPLSIVSLATLGGTVNLQSYAFAAGALNSSGFGPTTYNSTTLNASVLSGQIPDNYDLGNILAPGLDPSTLAAQLTLKFQTFSGGLTFKTAELQILAVPEPTVLSLVGIGAGALLARRRRNKQA